MCCYKIVYLSEQLYKMKEIYPYLPKFLYKPEEDMYNQKQTELLFLKMTSICGQLLEIISCREDYCYYHGVHMLKNLLTGEVIKIKMNEYDLTIEESTSYHRIFEILKCFSQHLYIIDFE